MTARLVLTFSDPRQLATQLVQTDDGAELVDRHHELPMTLELMEWLQVIALPAMIAALRRQDWERARL